MTTLFFMWGFMTVLNDPLIARFKEAFRLSNFQAMLVQLAFFGAYFIGAIIYYAVSTTSGDPINRIGYKNGVILGLLMSALGSALFYTAALMVSYGFFLFALFILGLGFTMLQIAANPYVTILGQERTASSRLNLSQAFNSFGTTLGPILGGYLIFEVFARAGAHGADSVRVPYLVFAGVFLVIAVLFTFARLPAFTNQEQIGRGLGALKHPHTALGMLAIFMYVGGEVTIGSAIILFLGSDKLGNLPHETASQYLAFYWGGLMIGRFMGAFALSEMRRWLKHLLVVAVPIAALAVILAMPWIAAVLHLGWAQAAAGVCSPANAAHYAVLLGILLVAFFAGEASPHRMLALFSVVIIVLLITGITTGGETAKWAILGIGLFDSVMWSNIFSLAIEGLGPMKSQGSSLLVMAILGGAVLPPIQGKVADLIGMHAARAVAPAASIPDLQQMAASHGWGIQTSFVVPIFAFAYVAFYGCYGYRAGRGR
jgi:FHS family L-fucose permease-like MFS transporter